MDDDVFCELNAGALGLRLERKLYPLDGGGSVGLSGSEEVPPAAALGLRLGKKLKPFVGGGGSVELGGREETPPVP